MWLKNKVITLLTMGAIAWGVAVPGYTDTALTVEATRDMFQDLKNYLGMVNAQDIKAQNILLYMLPPYIDITKTVGVRMGSAQGQITQWKEGVMRSVANYNVYTPAQSEDSYLANRLAFCGRNDKNKGVFKCDYTKAQAGNDVLAFSFLDPQAYQDEGQRMAALEYIINLTNPKPLNFPDNKKIFVDGKESKGLTAEGKKYFLDAYQQMPALSLAQNSLLAIYADRVRFKEFAKDLNVGSNGEASVMEMLNYEVSRRYMNADWYDAMNKASDTAVAREMANMMAVQLFLDVKRYEQMSRVEALLAAQSSTMVQLMTSMKGGGSPEDVTKSLESLEAIGK